MTRVSRSLLLLALWAGAGGAHAQEAAAARILLSLSPGASVSWRGVSPEEGAGSKGGMLYPAPNVGGMLVAVLTHAAIVQGVRSSERNASQSAADKVLEPHSTAIAELSAERLFDAARLRLPSLAAERHVVVQMTPTFSLTSDQRTIVLDNVLRVHAPDTPSDALYENTVRVISAPRDGEDPTAYWTGDEGRLLKEEVTAMLAHSIELSLLGVPAADSAPFRTQRYRFGAAQRMERGQTVAGGCGRVVLRTLRGWLMSVPSSVPDLTSPCIDAYRLEPV